MERVIILNWATGFPEDSSVVAFDSPDQLCALKVTEDHFHATWSVCVESAPPPDLTCRVFGTGNGWRTGAAERLCYQAPVSTAACSGAQLLQSPLTDTPGAPALPTLGRKAYVLSVLEHQHSPRRGGNNMLEVMEEIKNRQMKQKIKKEMKLMLSITHNG